MGEGDLLPVKFVDYEDINRTLGWMAMPVVPSFGDGVHLPGLYAAHVVSRRWEFIKPGDTVSMRDAQIDPQWPRWVAIVTLGDFEFDD